MRRWQKRLRNNWQVSLQSCGNCTSLEREDGTGEGGREREKEKGRGREREREGGREREREGDKEGKKEKEKFMLLLVYSLNR